MNKRVSETHFSFTTDCDRVLSIILNHTGFHKDQLEVFGFSKVLIGKFLKNCVKASYTAYEYERKYSAEYTVYSYLSFPIEVEELTNVPPDHIQHVMYCISLQYSNGSLDHNSLITHVFSKDVYDKDEFPKDHIRNIKIESHVLVKPNKEEKDFLKEECVEGSYTNVETLGVVGVRKYKQKIYCQRVKVPRFQEKNLMLYINYPVLFEYIKSGQTI